MCETTLADKLYDDIFDSYELSKKLGNRQVDRFRAAIDLIDEVQDKLSEISFIEK